MIAHGIRRSRPWLLIGLLLWAGVTAISGSSRLTALAADDSGWLLGQINTVRAQHGLPALTLNGQLTASASAHSRYLATNAWSDPHIESNGSTPRSRMIAAGYSGDSYGENVYGGGMATVQIAFNWWLGSPIHYAGIVSSSYTDIGIGIASGPYGQYFTTDFGRSSGAAAAPAAPVSSSAGQANVVSQSQPSAPHTALPTRRPLPTATPTATLTPSQTFTPRPTATATASLTTVPPTSTAIELAVSPLPAASANAAVITPAALAMAVSPTALSEPVTSIVPSPSPTAIISVSMLSADPVNPESVSSPAGSAGSTTIRTLIPVLIGLQAIIFGGLLIRRVRSG
jgi:hypothetical protein